MSQPKTVPARAIPTWACTRAVAASTPQSATAARKTMVALVSSCAGASNMASLKTTTSSPMATPASPLVTKTPTMCFPTTDHCATAVKAYSSATNPNPWAGIATPLKTIRFSTMATKIKDMAYASWAKPTTSPSQIIALATMKQQHNA